MTAAPKRAKRGRAPRPANDDATVSANKARAARSGLKGEAIVEAYAKVAAANGVALLHKVPTPTRRVKTARGWSMIYCARSHVDLTGMMLDGSGRHLAVEVKTCTAKPTFYLSEVEAHQRAYLDAVHEAGGVAALVVVGGPDLVAQVPWADARCVRGFRRLELYRYHVGPLQFLRRFLRGAQLTEDEDDREPAAGALTIVTEIAATGATK